ncbi:peptidyl-prolyl cis-trans isomerase [Ectothiorhodospiraceae bacterium 2226]|nr:peptidyl-prolyl cis-trans isomerase [Ectothiorhodospiraceae bacterium 2226]
MIRMHTNQGVIDIRLHEDKAPDTCKNFLRYVQEGFYDGTIFHRVINGFMIQGGGMEPGMREKQTHGPVRNEADNGLKNLRGTLAMARTQDPHSATAQFFINVADNAFLDHRAPTVEGWGYCVFGEVAGGMDTVDQIKRVPTTTRGFHQDVPADDVVIERVEVVDEA